MRKRKFKYYQKLLVKERTKILKELGYSEGIISKTQTEASGEISSYTYHMADQGTDTYQRELESKFVTMEHAILNKIEHALKKITDGSYGKCESCHKPISESRLEIIPYARYCVACQNQKDIGTNS